MITVDCISDTHGYYPELEGGDLLILAGDYTASNLMSQWVEFFVWLKKQQYTKKVLIAGNHDGFLESAYPKSKKESDELSEIQSFLKEQQQIQESDFEYLCDSGTEFEGLKIWGSPWSLWFHGINPHCKSFTGSECKLHSKFKLIPEDTDILITHTPMLHILDSNKDGYHCGSLCLRNRIDEVKPRLHVFGHIHECGEQQLMYKHGETNTWCVNASIVDERYKHVNNPVRIVL